MDNLMFPPFDYRINKTEGKHTIFDIIRKKHIVLTPEEWVRQHLIHYLIDQKKYPKSLIAVEGGMRVNKMVKRSDVVVYNRLGQIFLVVECKSTKIKLNQKSMDQLSVYNQHYKASYIALTNGLQVYICKMDYENKRSIFINHFPELDIMN